MEEIKKISGDGGRTDEDTLAVRFVRLPYRGTHGGQMSSYFWTTERHGLTLNHSTLPTFECYSRRDLNIS